MDVSPQAIREVQFRERLRGYHPDDVDDYLARVAAAVESLEQRLQQALERPEGPHGGESAELEESLRRTLLLAQRTADLAIQEAREEAARLLAEAEGRRQDVLAEAEQLRKRLSEEVDQAARAEIELLHDVRDQLQSDVVALREYLEGERHRLRQILSEQLRRLEEGAPVLARPPELHPVERAPGSADNGVSTGSAAPRSTGVAEGPVGEPTEAMARVEPEADEDPFMAELRLAATDEAPLGPRDPQDGAEVQVDVDIFEAGERGRIGSRLRRRR